MERKTIAKEIHITGIGLHKGGSVSLVLRPLEKGIVFVKNTVGIRAIPENIVDTRLNTSLGTGETRISTIEHLMSCLYGLGITDIEIELTGDEIPAMDGSALPFFNTIKESGIVSLGKEINPIIIREPIRCEKGDAWIEIIPGEFGVTYGIDFPEEIIGKQTFAYTGESYGKDIAPSRTFGRLEEVEMLQSAGFALGGGLDNAVVIDRDHVLNPEGLRFPDEFVRHKILDLLGDLWTIPVPLKGQVRAFKASHYLHIELAKKIYRNQK
ncbi:MAG: UDP-3-O-acyl-N-acetylglucosamine deacetylase [Thermodesulfobacteriota bacterium]|nr:UDP-3-O-acyl-N-acetylglucosamine deacetylase [Thermodesulfobacteriota bacterium]